MDWLSALDQDGTLLHTQLPLLIAGIEWIAALIDLAAIGVILTGGVRFIAGFLVSEFRDSGIERVRRVNGIRMSLGRYILASLELFIVADVVRVTTSLEFSALLFLGILVVIRTVISLALDREMLEIRKEME
jgi:uncharacterized membrane protein